MNFLRTAMVTDNESGMVHVGDEAKRFASGSAMVIAGVEIAKFIKSRCNVRQTSKLFEEADTDVFLMAGGGGTSRDGHACLVKFFVEDVHRFLNHFRAGLRSETTTAATRMAATVTRENSVEIG